MANKTAIYLSRKITLMRHGEDPLALEAGRNEVDADVAAHPFVKAHTVDAVDAATEDTAPLHARIAELEQRLVEAEAIPASGKAKARIAELEQALKQKEADMAALLESLK